MFYVTLLFGSIIASTYSVKEITEGDIKHCLASNKISMTEYHSDLRSPKVYEDKTNLPRSYLCWHKCILELTKAINPQGQIEKVLITKYSNIQNRPIIEKCLHRVDLVKQCEDLQDFLGCCLTQL